METWDKLPLELMDEFAERESFRRDVYRPPLSMHKWWARRPGSTFRILSIAALSDENTAKKDILRERPSGGYAGKYLENNAEKFEGTTVLDPFVGGGTTLLEANRVGATTIGYELNPVAWFISKKMIDEVDVKELEDTFDDVISDVRNDLEKYFLTNDPDTGKDAEILYSFQAQVVDCQNCGSSTRLHSNFILRKKQKTSDAVVYCPSCDEIFTRSRELTNNEKCDNCGHKFDPSDGNYGYGKFTCHNGHKGDIKEAIQRSGEVPNFEYFALQYKVRNNKKFKVFDSNDYDTLDELANKLDEEREGLPIPSQKIPAGDKTQALLNYNYTNFQQLWNYRHQYVFGKLFNRISHIDDQNIREFIILAVSNTIHYNSKLSKWQASQQKGIHSFDRHAYVPISEPVEGNPLNTDSNLVSLENNFKKILKGKEYTDSPFEKLKNKSTGEVEKQEIPGETVSENRMKMLECKTSESMSLDNESVDYVITDPPYYDNVQYSELSDYFYIWLREALQNDLTEFESELTPKAREIVSNTSSNKDEEYFIDALSNVFEECNRILDTEGELVFTYHHNENEAWSVILEALIESGFTVTGAYPVQSEFPNNMHVHNLDNAEYDILIFANKESVGEQISLHKLQENLHFELQDIIEEERNRHENLSEADLGVILRGKCMYYYSKHYPNVYRDGEQVSVDEALDAVDENIQQIIDSTVNLPQTVDPLSQAYAALYQRCNTHGPESYDDLNKHLLARNLNVSDLEAEKLIKGPRGEKEPVSADARTHHIEGKLNGSTPKDSNEDLLDIDKVHYLYNLYKTDQNTTDYLKAWKDNDVEELADFMAEVTGDERYSQVMEMTLTQY